MYEDQRAVKLLASFRGQAQVNDDAMQPWLTRILSCLSHQDLYFALNICMPIHSHAA